MSTTATGTKVAVKERARKGVRARGAARAARPASLQIGKGLDVGTAFIYCAQKSDDTVVFKTHRDAFFDVECSDFTKEMLQKCGVQYVQKGNRLYVLGEDAIQFANVFNRNTRRPLQSGVLSPAEADALPMVELIIKNVVGSPRKEGELIYYSLPGEPVDADFDLVYHESILRSLLQQLGYTAKPLNEGLAVIFAELPDQNFTGLGFSFGGGLVNVCFANRSVPVFSFSVGKAGDWIDEQVARVTNLTTSKITAIKEERLDLNRRPADVSKIERALLIYYRHLVEYVLQQVKRELEENARVPHISQPLNLVLAGGTAKPTGFRALFQDLLKAVPLPLEVGEVRLAAHPLHSVARGALIAAMTDEHRLE